MLTSKNVTVNTRIQLRLFLYYPLTILLEPQGISFVPERGLGLPVFAEVSCCKLPEPVPSRAVFHTNVP